MYFSNKMLKLIEPVDEDEDSAVINERQMVQTVEKETQENRLRVDELCKVQYIDFICCFTLTIYTNLQ